MLLLKLLILLILTQKIRWCVINTVKNVKCPILVEFVQPLSFADDLFFIYPFK